MFLVKLEDFVPLADAVFLFSDIADEADVNFTGWSLSLTASNRSLGFVAKLDIPHDLIFSDYPEDQDPSSRISLPTLHSAMWDGEIFSSMTIHIPPPTISQIILRFHNSTLGGPPQLRRELTLSPPQEADLGRLFYGRRFEIHSQDFRRIVREVSSFQNGSVLVTVTCSQVKFSIASSSEIILSQEARHCRIQGYEREFETQFRITLQPTLFFIKLTQQTNTVSFFTTIDGSHNVIRIPHGLFSEYVIYFPQM